MKDIPLIIPNFNQLTYLKNLITWFHYYYPENKVFVIDNLSNYKPLLDWYGDNKDHRIHIVRCSVNNCGVNLETFIKKHIHGQYKYYCISNADIMPHPNVPENFLEIFKDTLNTYRLHRVGFQLILDDLPDFIDNRVEILKNERKFWKKPMDIIHKGKKYRGYKAPIDLTFALYTVKNGGWKFKDRTKSIWENSLRLFRAFHFGWYIDPKTQIQETIQYFKNAKTKSDKAKLKGNLKGINTYRPKTFR